MKPQKILNNSDQSSDVMPAVNELECQLNSSDLLNVFKKNLEILRDNYLQLTQSEFYFGASEALEQTKHRLNPIDILHVDWVSRDALLNDYEVNLNQLREMSK